MIIFDFWTVDVVDVVDVDVDVVVVVVKSGRQISGAAGRWCRRPRFHSIPWIKLEFLFWFVQFCLKSKERKGEARRQPAAVDWTQRLRAGGALCWAPSELFNKTNKKMARFEWIAEQWLNATGDSDWLHRLVLLRWPSINCCWLAESKGSSRVNWVRAWIIEARGVQVTTTTANLNTCYLLLLLMTIQRIKSFEANLIH